MFYERFESLCKQNGTSPFACCKEIGLNGSTAAYWKKSGRPPKRETLEKIAERFNVSVDYLLDRESSEIKKSAIPIKEIISRDSPAVIPDIDASKLFDNLQKESQQQIIIGAPIKGRSAIKLKVVKPSIPESKIPKPDWIKLLSSLTDDNLKRLADYADLLLLQQSQADQAPK